MSVTEETLLIASGRTPSVATLVLNVMHKIVRTSGSASEHPSKHQGAEQSRAKQSRVLPMRSTSSLPEEIADFVEDGPFTDDVLFAALMIGEEFEDEFRKKEEPDGAEKSSTA